MGGKHRPRPTLFCIECPSMEQTSWGGGGDEGNVSRRKGCIFTFTAGRLVLPMLETEWRCKRKEEKTTKKQAGQTDTSSNSFSS